jgi:twinkle protein
MERDQQSDDDNISNTTTIRVLKNRYSGETGVACHLFFNKDTGRLQEVQSLGDNPDGGDDGDMVL